MRVESRESEIHSRKRQPTRKRTSSWGSLAMRLIPQPSTHNPQPSRGLTLTEVLISMGLMTLGLLGVMSLFPVGAHYMNKADVADRGSAVARSVMSDLVSRGMLNASAWRMIATTPPVPAVPPFPTVDGAINSYGRPVGPAIESWLSNGMAPAVLAQRAGNIYILDPIAAAVTSLAAPLAFNRIAATFPAEASNLPPSTYSGVAAWAPWISLPGPNDYWPMRRVTLIQPGAAAGSVQRMDPPLAWSLFSGNSDVAFEQPGNGDQPAVQLSSWTDRDGDNVRGLNETLSRQSAGDYSWIVTVAPTTVEARNSMGSGAFAYDISVVVFYKRGITPKLPVTNSEVKDNAQELQKRERVVKAKIVSTGPNGGEVLIETSYSGQANAWQDLRAGQWVMLCGPKPVMETVPPPPPEFAMGWYQVQAVDAEGAGVITDPVKQRLVTLRGPEWLWQPALSGITDNIHLSNNLCVGIMPGAVAVHTKTLRLQSASF